MEARTQRRLRSLFGKWSIPPWLLIVWAAISFASNVQFVIQMWGWARPRVVVMGGSGQAILLMLSGFAWLAVLVLRGDPAYDTVDLGSLSKRQLRRRTARLVAEMRAFEAETSSRGRLLDMKAWHGSAAHPPSSPEGHEAWQRDQMASMERHEAMAREYKTRFHGDAKALYDELRRRHGLEGRRPGENLPVALEPGMLAGVNPIQEAADYLERLARTLP